MGYIHVYSIKASDCARHSDNDGANAMLQMSKKCFTEARNHAIKINNNFLIIKVDIGIAKTYHIRLFFDKTEKYDVVVQFF